MSGALEGIKIVEISGLGPAPFAGMMLADAGADVLLIDRADKATYPPREDAHPDMLNRGRRSVAIDLKTPEGVELALDVISRADGVMEGFRPGVVERLGLGPAECLARNPKLVYGRMTGWGQDGPLAEFGGHDIDYIAVAGALEPIGRAGQAPTPPLNLVGDFGGGGMLLAFGMLAAIISAQRTGRGQVVDAAMVDGSAILMTMMHSIKNMGMWRGPRGTNILDTGAHFYEVYETADGRYMAVGAVEPKFYSNLLAVLRLDEATLPKQMDGRAWPEMKKLFASTFLSKTRDEWTQLFAEADACVVPVLSMAEAPQNAHIVHRQTFTEVSGVVQPSPAPRFSATPSSIRRPPPNPGQHGDEALAEWGFTQPEIAELRRSGAIR
ncbi:CaiB/BaiF CoA transferase family protein [Subtercola endophyticus]|uniref:CaiB/BaiF CoA transferase family protein n=1 Tax=Subtercola endophyticus TaxID=2895559 RepID=UPI001E29AACF|nr:CaiB/BaiF CoA-transferase family protein [Subtercola endophyticus]UFS58746.1 CoA transferase [Subtercola endophyticus]